MVESYTFYQRVWIQQELNRRMRIIKIKKKVNVKIKKNPTKPFYGFSWVPLGGALVT